MVCSKCRAIAARGWPPVSFKALERGAEVFAGTSTRGRGASKPRQGAGPEAPAAVGHLSGLPVTGWVVRSAEARRKAIAIFWTPEKISLADRAAHFDEQCALRLGLHALRYDGKT